MHKRGGIKRCFIHATHVCCIYVIYLWKGLKFSFEQLGMIPKKLVLRRRQKKKVAYMIDAPARTQSGPGFKGAGGRREDGGRT